ncbi:MAG: GTP-binding protein [Candidatus Omnitrophica bacterium CG23_combo_of_CG06-09_8_20_14_all_40_11]|nr:MAG: GTP-binding protein [Candidatus Omnitrophica bacterium CG23_combo_of_CG06-09_8_20_14_all_40_11]
MKYRILSKSIKQAVKTFPALVVTGPRQSGKTTLLKHLFSATHSYSSLEDPDTRMRVKDDPRGFLRGLKMPAIIDEIQYATELLPYIKTEIDEKRKPGNWLLTGSQSFVLMQGVSESLAGRAAILSLLPFNYVERIDRGENAVSADKLFKLKKEDLGRNAQQSKASSLTHILLRGFYPEIASRPSVAKNIWCGSYISSYLERDIRNLTQVGDLSQFERFLRLCAIRTGQILNLSELAKECGISVPTAKRWLSLLETGYQVFLLYPYYKNIGKRLVKSPKLYFTDTALVCYLLGLADQNVLIRSPYFAHIFETFVIVDFWKRFLHFAQPPSMYYVRTRDGMEVDLVIESGGKLHLFEVKSTATVTSKHIPSLIRAKNDLADLVGTAGVISQSADSFYIRTGIYNYGWQDIVSF